MSAVDEGGLAVRVSELRHRRGLSQRDLAASIGRSESWVSQVERGVLPVERLSVLQSLADALEVSVQDLRPDAVAQHSADHPVSHLEDLRLALTGHPALGLALGTTTTKGRQPKDLAQQVELAWELVHASRFTELSRLLTRLIPQLELASRTANSSNRPQLAKLLTSAYQAAAAAFARQDEADASWVAAERAIALADRNGDGLDIVAGHFRMAHAFITLRHLDQAERVASAAIDALRPMTDRKDCPAEALSLNGAMHLILAVVQAREGNRDGVRRAINQARRIASRLSEDRNDFNTEFGPTNVELHAISTAVDLGDAGEALHLARGVDPQALSPERQSRLHIDLARAHAQRRHPGEALAALLQAEQVAPEQVRTHVFAREVARDLLVLAGRRPPAELVEFVGRLGATP